jgi:hypothetical protein
MDECPVCLEALTGTVVHLGCCNKQVHIQCYITRCPLCRAELPAPPFTPPQHVIVPVPVPVPQPTRVRSIGAAFLITLIVCAALFSPLPPRHSSP